jgi:hypothetical protein
MAVVVVLVYLVAVLTMGVNDEEQCNEGGTAGDYDDDNRRGDRSKSFGVGGRGRFDKDGRRRRVEEACRWAAAGAMVPRCCCPPGAALSPPPHRSDGPTVTTVIAAPALRPAATPVMATPSGTTTSLLPPSPAKRTTRDRRMTTTAVTMGKTTRTMTSGGGAHSSTHPPPHCPWSSATLSAMPLPRLCLSVHLSVCLEYQNTQNFNVGIKIRVSTWSFLSFVHPLRIPIPMCKKKIRVQQENSYKITYCLHVFPT